MTDEKAGRTLTEILADPSTPRKVASLIEAALLAWERHDIDHRRLCDWAMLGRAIESEGRDA